MVAVLLPEPYITFNKSACSCGNVYSQSGEMAMAQSVFVGKVIDARLVSYSDGRRRTEYQFEPISAWKGATQTQIGVHKLNCNAIPEPGEFWLVYAQQVDDGHLWMDVCGNSSPLWSLDAKSNVEALGEVTWGRKAIPSEGFARPVKPNVPSATLAKPMVFVIALIVLVVGVATWMRKRSDSWLT
jgi:hypothetical protein